MLIGQGFSDSIRDAIVVFDKWTYCESTQIRRFSLLHIPLLGFRSGRKEPKNQAQRAGNHTCYFGSSVNA
jgi:hypothetical protein